MTSERTPAPTPLADTAARPVLPPAAPRDALPRPMRVALMVLPLVALAVAYMAARVVRGPGHADEMVAAAAANVLGLGTTVIFGAAVLGETAFVHLSTLDLAIVTVLFNTALAVVFVGAFDGLERLPFVGPRLARARAHALSVACDRVWIRRWATAGVALFVISPLPASGVIGGTLVGRAVGLTRLRTFVAVTVANTIVCSIYALGADALEQWMRRSRMTMIERLGVFAASLVFAIVLIKWLIAVYTRSSPTKDCALDAMPAGSADADDATARGTRSSPRLDESLE